MGEMKTGKYIGLKEACTILGADYQNVLYWVRSGKFKTAKKVFGTRWKIKKSEVKQFKKDFV